MIKPIHKHHRPTGWSQELQDLVRGASGGFLFGIPLLYTIEVWQIGSYTEPPLMLCILAVTYVVIFLLNHTEGFRQKQRDGALNAAAESIEALAIGMLCAAFMLVLLRRITWDTSLGEALGKIIFEGVPFSLGVTLARLLLTGDSSPLQQGENYQSQMRQSSKHSISKVLQTNKFSFHETLADISATLFGAIIIAFSIAPTDEITTLAAAASPPWLLALIAVSLLISYGIVFAAGFTNQYQRRQQQGLFQTPEGETVFSYLISLLASALMLWFFQRLGLSDPWFVWLRYTLVLGLPATIGGAAGRLAV